MRDLRAFVDVGQERLASRMSCSRSRLSQFENAADLPGSAAWRRWLAAIREVGSVKPRDDGWRAAFSAKLAGAEHLYAAATAEASAQPTAAGRADMPPHGSASGAGVVPDGPELPVPAGDLGAASAIQAFRSADRRVGGGHLYQTVVAYLATGIAPVLFGTVDGTGGTTPLLAAAALTEMAGWMAHDAGHDHTARRHLGRAFDLANAGGDRRLAAHIMASMSHLADHLRDPRAAIGFAERGLELLASGPPHPEVEARLHAMNARGEAALGDRAECAGLLIRAERALDGAGEAEPSPWISGFDHGSLAGEAARCLRRLGQLDHARRQVELVIDLRSGERSRSRAFGQLILVSVLIEQGRLDEACAVATSVIDATTFLGSFQVVRRLRNLRPVLDPYRAIDVVDAFLVRLDRALRERRWLLDWAPTASQGRTETLGVIG